MRRKQCLRARYAVAQWLIGMLTLGHGEERTMGGRVESFEPPAPARKVRSAVLLLDKEHCHSFLPKGASRPATLTTPSPRHRNPSPGAPGWLQWASGGE
jgi:hypothetical protein